MFNQFLLERLAWQRIQEELRLAERMRLAREAERSHKSIWSRVARALEEGAAASNAGGRIPPDATRAGEMPGL